MENKITAVEWLINEIPEIDWSDTYWKLKFEQAKEIEKQQIIDAYTNGLNFDFEEYEIIAQSEISEAEQYYKETFKN